MRKRTGIQCLAGVASGVEKWRQNGIIIEIPSCDAVAKKGGKERVVKVDMGRYRNVMPYFE